MIAPRKIISRLLNDVFVAPHDYMNRFGDNPHSNFFVNFVSRPDTRVITVMGSAFAAHAAVTGNREDSAMLSFATLLGTGLSLALTTYSNRKLKRDRDTGEDLPMLYIDTNKPARSVPAFVADMARRDRDAAALRLSEAAVGIPLLTATFLTTGYSLLSSFTAAACLVAPHAGSQVARYVRAGRVLSGQWDATTNDAPPPPPSPRRREEDYGPAIPALSYVRA